MFPTLSRNWWAVALRGVVAVIFGVLALSKPGITLEALVYTFGFFAIVDGTFSLVGGLSMIGSGAAWGGPVFGGIGGIGVGVLTFFWPGLTALGLLYLISFWAIFTGLMELTAAVQFRKEATHPVMLGIAGVLSVSFGLLLVIFPGAGALSVVWLIGVYAIAFGVTFIALGFRLRGVEREVSTIRHAIQGA
jgi:uncharacterized membrane protein HdeD (DUF308 family)